MLWQLRFCSVPDKKGILMNNHFWSKKVTFCNLYFSDNNTTFMF